MKILMVCLGNICRSPLAHGILQAMAKEAKLPWTVESAGTSHWHEGEAPDRRSIAAAKDLGYDISQQRARHFNASFFAEYDCILVMDEQNYRDVCSLASDAADIYKVRLFMPATNVTDPYYDDALFAPVARQIEQHCKQLLSDLG
jgi:protein-tyrosine phosphatase